MKIAVTSNGPTLDAMVETRFGRCPYFLCIDLDTEALEAIPNPNIALSGGAGPQSAQLMAEKGVSAVLTGNCGPNAFQTFGAAGIQVITGVSGPVREAVEKFKAGRLKQASTPSVQGHYGTGGMGGSRGMGGGRGMGRGRGMGGGRGIGGAGRVQ
jgi:predicted Fe-Mo cluster-binding NifX family protein